eukprot:gnl/MRDRNA2_/MRDRNA2_85629_c0_seq1.p1 gnl/MRDRNA2_/MRDRNA2_85629_c0~~gnl/MRDRNA2_/MRDRNA2_85629_c0_seq1.p1  ORF type:complete len:564 (+),score=75.87 gnl/MRDRNA2_/MRDRNA2_85629_c0_seq1:144-1694(+)
MVHSIPNTKQLARLVSYYSFAYPFLVCKNIYIHASYNESDYIFVAFGGHTLFAALLGCSAACEVQDTVLQPIWSKMLPRVLWVVLLIGNCPLWFRPLGAVDGVMSVLLCIAQHGSVHAFVSSQKALNQALQKNQELLSSVFDATVIVKMQNEQALVVSASQQFDEIFGQRVQGQALNGNVIYGFEQLTSLFEKRACSNSVRKVRRALLTCICSEGFEFDCEFRTAHGGAEKSEELLLGITLVGERRPATSFPTHPSTFSCASSDLICNQSTKSSESVKSHSASVHAASKSSQASFFFSGVSALLSKHQRVQKQMPDANELHDLNIPSFISFILSHFCDLILECAWDGKSLQVSGGSHKAELLFGTDLAGWPVECIIDNHQREYFKEQLNALLEKTQLSDPHPKGFAIHDFGELFMQSLLLCGGTISRKVCAVALPQSNPQSALNVLVCLCVPFVQSMSVSLLQRSAKSTLDRHDVASKEGTEEITPSDSVSATGNKGGMAKRRMGGPVRSDQGLSL